MAKATALWQRKTLHFWGWDSLEESLVFWMSIIPLPHSSLTHGASPDYLSWSILGSCHCGIEVPLV